MIGEGKYMGNKEFNKNEIEYQRVININIELVKIQLYST